jgi:hypothetical protein
LVRTFLHHPSSRKGITEKAQPISRAATALACSPFQNDIYYSLVKTPGSQRHGVPWNKKRRRHLVACTRQPTGPTGTPRDFRHTASINFDAVETPELNYEQWRDLLRPNFGLYTVDNPKTLPAGFAPGTSSDLMRPKSGTINAIANGHKGIFALTALITAVPYFRSLNDQRSFKMIGL